MLNYIFPVILILILWYISFDCNSKLSQHLPKEVILVFTTIAYFIIIIVYMYYNFDYCYEHFSMLNYELMILLLLVSTVTLVGNLIFIHAKIPKLI